ncbi:Proton channel OtopLc, partial [Fragariocoptes setiger]
RDDWDQEEELREVLEDLANNFDISEEELQTTQLAAVMHLVDASLPVTSVVSLGNDNSCINSESIKIEKGIEVGEKEEVTKSDTTYTIYTNNKDNPLKKEDSRSSSSDTTTFDSALDGASSFVASSSSNSDDTTTVSSCHSSTKNGKISSNDIMPSSSSSMGSNTMSSKNYKFGLTNHHLSMPEPNVIVPNEQLLVMADSTKVRHSHTHSSDSKVSSLSSASLKSSGSCDSITGKLMNVTSPVYTTADLSAKSQQPMAVVKSACIGKYRKNCTSNVPSKDRCSSAASIIGADSTSSSSSTNGQSIVSLDESSANLTTKRARCDSHLLVKFCSIIYATFLVILGCILHIAELRHKSRNSTDHIYSSCVALIGIAWLAFLHVDLQRYKRYACKFILIEHMYSQKKGDNSGSSNCVSSSSTSTLANSTTSSYLDGVSMNTEAIFKKTAIHMSVNNSKNNKSHKHSKQEAIQSQNAVITRQPALSSAFSTASSDSTSSEVTFGVAPRHQATNESTDANGFYYDRHQQHHHHHRQLDDHVKDGAHLHDHEHRNYSSMRLDSLRKNKLKSKMTTKKQRMASKLKGQHKHQLSDPHKFEQQPQVPAYRFVHGKMGANFYLKCGMAAFCFGHVIHEGLRFGQQVYFFMTDNVQCRDVAALVAHLITPLYSFYQLFMMFKYSNLVINRFKTLAYFGLMHIIGTSITFWFRTIIEEAFEDFVHKMDYFGHKAGGANSSRIYGINNTKLVQLPRAASASQSASIIEALTADWAADEASHASTGSGLMPLMSSPVTSTISPQLASNLPNSYACAQNTLLTTKSMNALPYLYPFTIEYNLLLAATFLGLYCNIGQVWSRSTDKGCSSHPFIRRELVHNHENGKEELEYKSNFVVNADCHAANKGLFCGFFVLLVTLVSIVIFFVTINKPTHIHLGIKINLIQEAALTILILTVTLAAFRQVVKLDRNPCLKDKVTTDDVLMLVPLPFFFIHSLLSFRAEIASLSWPSISTAVSLMSNGTTLDHLQQNSLTRFQLNNSANNINANLSASHNRTFTDNSIFQSHHHHHQQHYQMSYFKWITVAAHAIVLIEVLVQTNFIIDGKRRCSQSRYLRFKKPGRELITFAIILNITYWIVATFESKSVEQYRAEIEFYGPLPWMFVSHTTLPVMLFYRYHSSVCLAEIWGRAYKPAKKY